jgi:glycosyltransferase involved in cell wall biosynthesis
VVQIGTGFLAPTGVPTVTHDDMTVVQAVEHRYGHWPAMSRRAIRGRIEIQRLAYERAVACCVTTNWAAHSVIDDYGIQADKVHVVGVGRNHAPEPKPRDWSVPRFLFVGKDWERKNGAAVLRAFERLRGYVKGARLDVVGLHPAIDMPGVTGHGFLRLEIPAERGKLDRLFESATCFVMPSFHEPFGIVFAEASAAGIPSIGTTCGGSIDLLGDTGRVVEPTDDEALLAAMRELSDGDTAHELGSLARARAELLTWEAVAGRILRALALDWYSSARLPAFL